MEIGRVAAGRLVGRRREMRAVETALAGLRAGRPGQVWIRGEAGIGKTRLLGELTRHAEEAGHLVLTGRAAEFERDVPYALWVDALEDHLERVGEERLKRLLGDRASDVTRLLPDLVTAEPVPGLPGERYLGHRA